VLYGLDIGGSNGHIFQFGNGLYKLRNVVFRELIEPDTHKLVLQRFLDFANVIANETKPHIGTAHLQQGFERLLRVFGHVIHFIQNDEFQPRFKQMVGFDKLIDLVANNVDTPFVGRIQVNDIFLVFMRGVGFV